MTEPDETAGSEERSALISRLHLIEDQPLQTRAAAFAGIHDNLRAILEGGDAPEHHA